MLSKSDLAIKNGVDSKMIKVDLETGNVYSWHALGRGNCGLRSPVRRKLKVRPDCHGYQVISLNSRPVFVHRVVAYVVFGDAIFGEEMVVDHKNRDRWDCRGENLVLI